MSGRLDLIYIKIIKRHWQIQCNIIAVRKKWTSAQGLLSKAVEILFLSIDCLLNGASHALLVCTIEHQLLLKVASYLGGPTSAK